MLTLSEFFTPSSRWYYPVRWLFLLALGLTLYQKLR